MKTSVFLCGALFAALYGVGAQNGPPPHWMKKAIDHDKVQPFAQPEPTTISDKAAVKFKPQLHISHGCHSYPAVNEVGEVSAGLKGSGRADGMCKGSKHGSQVYGRSAWHKDKWAIMYTWYFPKDVMEKPGRHDWEYVVLWLDNPAVDNQMILPVSRLFHVPLGPEFMDGPSTKLNYGDYDERHMLTLTHSAGEFQPLIMWDQLPEKARESLNKAIWNHRSTMPISDARFTDAVDADWPFPPV